MGLGGNLFRWLWEPSPAGLGIEFRSGQVVLARFGQRRRRLEMDLCLQAPLPAGVVAFSMFEPNLKEPELLADFLHQLLSQAGVSGRRIGLTLPDPLAHISVLDLPENPRSRKETLEHLRFHLKKSLPFEVNDARIAYAAVPGKKSSFLTGVIHNDVVSQYEQLLEGLGFHVGTVEISSMSLLGLWRRVSDTALPAGADYLFLNIEDDYFTITLVRGVVPVLFRIIGRRSMPEEPDEPIEPSEPSENDSGLRYQADELMRAIIPTLDFYHHTLGGDGLASVYIRSLRPDMGELEGELRDELQIPVEPLDLQRAVVMGDNLNVQQHLATTVAAAAGAALGGRAWR